jgi:outer membrane protein
LRISFIVLLLTAVPRAGGAAVPVYGLTDLFRSSVETADVVRTKREERIQAEEEKARTTSGFLPQVYGVASYTRNDSPPRTGAIASIFPESQKNARLVGKQYLFQGGSEYAYLSRSKRIVESKEAEVDNSRRQYYLDLSSAYYAMLLAQSNLGHARTELELYDDQIRELRSRVRIGRSRPTDQLSAEAARAASEARVRIAESELVQARLALATLAHLEPEFTLREENPVDRPLDGLDAYLSASRSRPDLVAARKQLEAAESQVSYARGFHFPTLDLGANYYLHREGGNANSKWDATLTLTVPLFAGGATQAGVREAASLLRVSEISVGLAERSAETEIRTLHQNLVASENEMKSLDVAVDLANRAYLRTKQDYRLGLNTNLDLLAALRALTDARRTFDQARYQHTLERIRLEIGAGRIPTG